MDLRILFNSSSIEESLAVGWGLSVLIDKKIIFDTGEKGDLLINNINRLEVDVSVIEKVVISHDHWDHTGGLWDLLKQNPRIKVYGCSGFSERFKKRVAAMQCELIEQYAFVEVAENVYITGEILGTYKNKAISEQAVVVNADKGLTVLTGCAHPGIIELLDIVRTRFPNKQIYSVLGGFHLINQRIQDIESLVNEFRKLDVKKVGPTHCSGIEAENIFKNVYQDDFLSMKVGESITV